MTVPLSNNSSLDLLARELKSARLGKKLSLDDVSQLTKIQKHYLEQIEDGNFRFLPNSYVHACIKEYRRELGLNNNELLEEYKKELKIPGASNRKDVIKVNSDCSPREKIWKNKKSRETSELLKSILPLTIGIVVGVLGVVGFSYMDNISSISVPSQSGLKVKTSVNPVEKSVIKSRHIDSLYANHKGKYSKSLVRLSVPAKPSPTLVDTSVTVFAPIAPPFSETQE
jgi:cytoskeleton protein RodZ